MPASTANSSYWAGFTQGLPFILVIVPFGMLFGVVGTEAGLNLTEVMAFTILVIAGAAQFTAVQLMTENAPVVLIVAAALVVNLRMAMYSAALVPYLGAAPLWQRALIAYLNVDQCYACSAARYQTHPEMSVRQRVAFFLGVASPVAPLWYAATLLGAVVGTTVPDGLALDFALPITFIAMLGPLLRDLPNVVAALVSAVVALLLAGLPPGVGLMIAAAVALVAGAAVELWLERRA